MTPRCQPLPSCTTLSRHVDKLEADAAIVLPAAVSNSAMVKHVCNSGLTVNLNVPTTTLSVSMVVLLMITSYTQSNPRTRTRSNTLPANATASLRLLQTHRSSSPSQQARIKPPQRPLQTMSRACLDVKRLYDWMRKSLTSSGLTASRKVKFDRYTHVNLVPFILETN